MNIIVGEIICEDDESVEVLSICFINFIYVMISKNLEKLFMCC